MIIQFCGLSGAGKTTIAHRVAQHLQLLHIPVEIIDGDDYRKVLCADLGFSREDRNTNIRRLAFVASKLSKHGVVAIICAINPYESVRQEVTAQYSDVITVYIRCGMETLLQRDTKGLYKKAMLPDEHPDKVHNLTGVNDPFDIPTQSDIVIDTDSNDIETCAKHLAIYITNRIRQATE